MYSTVSIPNKKPAFLITDSVCSRQSTFLAGGIGIGGQDCCPAVSWRQAFPCNVARSCNAQNSGGTWGVCEQGNVEFQNLIAVCVLASCMIRHYSPHFISRLCPSLVCGTSLRLGICRLGPSFKQHSSQVWTRSEENVRKFAAGGRAMTNERSDAVGETSNAGSSPAQVLDFLQLISKLKVRCSPDSFVYLVVFLVVFVCRSLGIWLWDVPQNCKRRTSKRRIQAFQEFLSRSVMLTFQAHDEAALL